jgi:hypothetical protein
VRFRKKAGRVAPRYLAAATRERVLPLAAELLAVFGASVGSPLGELDEAVNAIPFEARDRLVASGLRKLCEDRLVIDRPEGLDPIATRAEVFTRAAAAHRSSAPFDRASVLSASAAAIEASPEAIEAALFSDLRAAQIVKGFDAVTPGELLAGYDLALAQAALFRAARVVVTTEGGDTSELRSLFRAARFHGLLFQIARRDGAYELAFDGPFSLFESVQKYGFRLAMFLPSVLSLPRFELRAELYLGAKKERAEMVVSHADAIARARAAPLGLRPELEQLISAFRAIGSSWSVRPCDEILPLPGQAVIVPDLAFTSEETGEVVYLEMMGFWSRDAVFKRIEQVERGLEARLLLAVSKKLRVSREALDESSGSSLIVFGSALSAKEVLSRLATGPRIGAQSTIPS